MSRVLRKVRRKTCRDHRASVMNKNLIDYETDSFRCDKPGMFGIGGVEQKIVRVKNGETRFPMLRSLCGNQHDEAVPSLDSHATVPFVAGELQ
jgi:hypothetical protein